MHFILTTHQIRAGVPVIEVWEDDELYATLVPGDVIGELRLITKHLVLPTVHVGEPIILSMQIVKRS